MKVGTEDRWSDEVYTVEGIKGMSVILSDDKTYKRDKLLKIPKDTIKVTDTSHTTNLKPNIIKQATKERKREILHKQVGVDEANIVSTKREKKARDILDL